MKAVQILMMNKSGDRALYGYLYNWYAASDVLFAPSGWHLPTKTETDALLSFLGASDGGAMKEIGLSHWTTPNTGATNSSGFTGLPGGYRIHNTGIFTNITNEAHFWTSTVLTGTASYKIRLLYDSAAASTLAVQNKYGYSIRLIKDDSTDPSTMTDYDGNVYDTVKIDSQVWIVQNWKCTKLNDGTPLTKVTNAAAWAALTTEGYCAYDNLESNV